MARKSGITQAVARLTFSTRLFMLPERLPRRPRSDENFGPLGQGIKQQGYDCQTTTRNDKEVMMSTNKDEYGKIPVGAMRGIE
jgi:hypothetical protein